jgi:hypothetical protein
MEVVTHRLRKNWDAGNTTFMPPTFKGIPGRITTSTSREPPIPFATCVLGGARLTHKISEILLEVSPLSLTAMAASRPSMWVRWTSPQSSRRSIRYSEEGALT